MPFGGDCEYPTFNACVGRIMRSKGLNRSKAQAYCAELQRRTEEHCRRINATAAGDSELAAICHQELNQIAAELDESFGV